MKHARRHPAHPNAHSHFFNRSRKMCRARYRRGKLDLVVAGFVQNVEILAETLVLRRLDASTKRLSASSATCIIARVRWLKTIVTMLLLAVWLPGSSHSLLESLELIHQHHGEPDSSSQDADDHDVADGICRIESDRVQAPQRELSASLLPLGWTDSSLTVTALFQASLSLPTGLAPPGTAPPQLSHCWQFSFRAALPVRAPSFAS